MIWIHSDTDERQKTRRLLTQTQTVLGLTHLIRIGIQRHLNNFRHSFRVGMSFLHGGLFHSQQVPDLPHADYYEPVMQI